MLGMQMSGYTKPCKTNTGGISRVFVFDPEDFNFTQGAAPNNTYTAVALNAGATLAGGSGFFEIQFDYLEGQYKASQTAKGSSVKYSHSLSLHVPWLGNDLTNFLLTMQKALACDSLGFIIQMQNGVILVMGESVVNGSLIPYFRVIMDGTDVDGGKAFDDANGAGLMFKGDYSRPLYEFSGGIAAIEGLLGTAIY